MMRKIQSMGTLSKQTIKDCLLKVQLRVINHYYTSEAVDLLLIKDVSLIYCYQYLTFAINLQRRSHETNPESLFAVTEN